jgi:hypothetical protein
MRASLIFTTRLRHERLQRAITDKLHAARAIVDAEDFLRLNRYRWLVMASGKQTYVYRSRLIAGRQRTLLLARAITNAPRGVFVRHLNGDAFDFRRANLKVEGGSVCENRHSKRNPFTVHITIDSKHFYVGSWPTKEWAEVIREIAQKTAARLRGRGRSYKSIQRALDLATGREKRKRVRWLTGDELIKCAASALPKTLTLEAREDAIQAMCLDLIAGNIEVEALKEKRVVNRYIADARGLNDRFRFVSMDAPIGDSDLTVGDRLVA